jgi:hypothetical protein
MQMFTVSKFDLPRYWWAYAGHIEERVGEIVEGDNSYFLRKQDAIHHAENLKTIRLHREFLELKNRVTPMALKILRIRSLWNSTLRANVQSYLDKLHAAEQALATIPAVEIAYLPDSIPVTGDRIALGTRVYEFDSYSLQLHVSTVESESIRYYEFHPEGVAASYRLSNGRSVNSTLESGFSNIEYYLDSEEANTRMRDAVNSRIEELQEQLR